MFRPKIYGNSIAKLNETEQIIAVWKSERTNVEVEVATRYMG